MNEETFEDCIRNRIDNMTGLYHPRASKLYMEFNNDLNKLPQQSNTVQENVNKANQVHLPRNRILTIIILAALKSATRHAKIYISKDDRKGLLYVRNGKLEIEVTIGTTTSTRIDRKEKQGDYQIFVDAPDVGFLESQRPIVILGDLPKGYAYNKIITLDKLILNLLRMDRAAYNNLFF